MYKILKNTAVIFFALFHFQQLSAQDLQRYSLVQLDSILDVFVAAEEYHKIMPYAQIGVKKAEEAYGKQDTTYAKMLFFLGLAYEANQDIKTAISYCQQAIEIQKIKIPKHPDYASSLSFMGIMHFYISDYAMVEKYFKETVALRKEILGVQHPDYAYSLNNLAILYKNLGAYKEAELLYKETLDIYKKTLGLQHPDYSLGLNNLAALYAEMGRYEEAEPLYKEAIASRRKLVGIKHPSYATSVNNLAALYCDMGNYAEAEPLHKEALALRKEVLGEKHHDYAASLNNLASVYSGMKNYSNAEYLYKEAINVLKEVVGEKHFEYANGLNNLANLYLNLLRYDEAETLYKKALAIRKAIFGIEHPRYAATLNNLAALYDNMGRYADAERLYKEAQVLRNNIFGKRHPNYIGGLNNLTLLYLNMKLYKEAWNYNQEAILMNSGLYYGIGIQKNRLDSFANAEYISIEQMLETLRNTYFLLEVHKIPDAQAKQTILSELALQLLKKSRDNFVGEEDKLRSLGQSSEWTLRGLRVMDKTTQAHLAFAFAEQNKSVLLMDAAKTERAYSMGDLPDSLMQKEEALQKERSSLQAMLVEKRAETEKDSLRRILNHLGLKISDFKKHIEKTYPQYAALKYEQKEATIPEIQSKLDDKTVLLEYVVGDSMIYIFYIDNKTIKIIESPVNTTELNFNIKQLHTALSNYTFISTKPVEAYQLYTENAFWFYQKLLAPALQEDLSLKQIKNLIIVADGELGHLPFEAFLVTQAPQTQTDYHLLNYLVQNYTISYNYSATLYYNAQQNLNEKQHKSPSQNGILAMAANYEMPIDSSATAFRLPFYQRLRKTLFPLPSARKEVEVLSEKFQGFFAFDKMASEKIFKEKAADFSIIHLAMHGLLDNEKPILSSLAFTEDSDSAENNFLQAYEISKLKLNADLVVLSACETGYGRFEQGNGIASLARAFSYAGASSLVVSLWQVSDYATSEIMQKFYQNLADGMKKDEALRQAKIQYMQSAKGILAHPAFWSPFIQMGNTDGIVVEKRRAFSVTWAIIGISLAVAGGLWAMRRKAKNH